MCCRNQRRKPPRRGSYNGEPAKAWHVRTGPSERFDRNARIHGRIGRAGWHFGGSARADEEKANFLFGIATNASCDLRCDVLPSHRSKDAPHD
jgi:hypothetical protein